MVSGRCVPEVSGLDVIVIGGDHRSLLGVFLVIWKSESFVVFAFFGAEIFSVAVCSVVAYINGLF